MALWLLLLACRTTTAEDKPAPPVTFDGAVVVDVPAEAVLPSDETDPLTPALRAIFDDAPCMGPLAKAQVYRDTQREVRAFLYHADRARCGHAPSVYYAPDGKRRDLVELQSISAENLAEVKALHTRNRDGGTPAEVRYFR
jgi:hypothetical protein